MLLKECRICYEDEEENRYKLIYPCACDGSRKYVHAQCLNKWRNLKYQTIDFLQCQECKQFYNISKIFPRETFTIGLGFPTTLSDGLGVLLSNIGFWFISFILATIDRFYKIPKTFLVSKTIIQPLIFYFKRNVISYYIYNYSFVIFIFTIFIYIIMLISIQLYIRHKKRYWERMYFPYFSGMALNSHFIYLSFFITDNEQWIYIYTTGLMSLFQFYFILFYFQFHDDTIRILNTTANKEYIKNYKKPRRQTTQDVSRENIIINIEDSSYAIRMMATN